jgi:hypothetical protein
MWVDSLFDSGWASEPRMLALQLLEVIAPIRRGW